MNIPIVELLEPGPLQTERLPDGRRRLLRDLNLQIGERVLSIPAGFETDYSSWPRWLPGPNFQRIDVAGVVHDFLFKTGRWGTSGTKLTYLEANRLWYVVARSGTHPRARAGLLSAWIGRIGLLLFAWPVWRRYRRGG